MSDNSNNAWLMFALLTVANWGVYGILLHTGQLGMNDAINGRYKAFLWVGIAYVLIAVLAPLAILIFRNTGFTMPIKGIAWSLIAGVTGAIGAFCVLLAFGAKGHPAVVMSIIFAGAPIVNAIVSIAMHPPADGIGSIRWQFFAGILLAALGGTLVTMYKPGPGVKPAKSPPIAIAPAEQNPSQS